MFVAIAQPEMQSIEILLQVYGTLNILCNTQGEHDAKAPRLLIIFDRDGLMFKFYMGLPHILLTRLCSVH